MNPIVKPWPFRGWGIYLIGQNFPPSSKGHIYIGGYILFYQVGRSNSLEESHIGKYG
jgi:hypothetical protein